jgi:predicted amidophosphoribosyltransferase
VTLQQIVDLVFPPQCGGCDAPGTGACERCLPYDCIASSRLRTLTVVSLAPYEGALRHAVLALKNGRRDVARSFSLRLCDLVTARDVLVPVPTTAARRRERGFDGCCLMAQTIAGRTGALVLPHLVQVAGDRQRGRTRDARLSARGRFSWRGPALAGTRVTLLDDVVTTGATLEDCAAALRAAGAIVQRAIAVARA